MTKITEALDRAARQCSVKRPSSWLSATRDDHLELKDFLDETVEDILDRLDPPSPISGRFEITGTGADTYALALDFRRLARGEYAVYDKTQDRPCVAVKDDGTWEHLKDTGTAGAVRYFRLLGYAGNRSIEFYNAPTSADEIVVSFVSNSFLVQPGGATASAITSNDDTLLFPRKLVESGIVWRFRERRGLPYMDKYAEYTAHMARYSNEQRANFKVNMEGANQDVRWQELIPAFVPPA